jgi:hypothetical protein
MFLFLPVVLVEDLYRIDLTAIIESTTRQVPARGKVPRGRRLLHHRWNIEGQDHDSGC